MIGSDEDREPALFGSRYGEGTYCMFRDDVSDDDREFIEWAWRNLIEYEWIIEDYFAARGERWDSLRKHLEGENKIKLKVKDLPPNQRGAGWADIGGGGLIVIDEDLITCERNKFGSSSVSWSESACVLLDMSALLLHELSHVVWTGDKRAYGLEGYWRYHVQDYLYLTDTRYCGQNSWPCGTSTSRRDGCTADVLQSDRVTICGDSGDCCPG